MLIKCPECGNPISSKAVSCPHCGYPLAAEMTDSSEYEPAVKVHSPALVVNEPIDPEPPIITTQKEDSKPAYTHTPIPEPYRKEKSSKGIASLTIACLLGLAYIAYSFYYWTGVNIDVGNTINSVAKDSWESLGLQLGASIATQMVMPHLACSGLAALFNVLAIFTRKRGFALTAAILYSVALVLFPTYFMFVIIQAILCFIAFARMAS